MAGTSQDEPGHTPRAPAKAQPEAAAANTALAIVDSLKYC
jgi:hypothetical protein